MDMNTFIHAAVPLLIMLAMGVVGLEVTLDDLKRVMHLPRQVSLSLFGQILLLPLWAGALAHLLGSPPALSGAMMLIACAPQATMSNLFCLVARADVALSVTLTAVSSLLALLTTPLSLAVGFHWLFDLHGGMTLPVGRVMRHLATGIFLPLGAGMLARHLAGAFVTRHRRKFQSLSMTALCVLLVMILYAEGAAVIPVLAPLLALASAFTLGAALMGFGLARLIGWPRREVVTLTAAFPARSLSVATLVTVSVLGQSGFLALAAVFFVIQAALMLPLMGLMRHYDGSVGDTDTTVATG